MQRRSLLLLAAAAGLLLAACNDDQHDGNGVMPTDNGTVVAPDGPKLRSLALAGFRQIDSSGTAMALTSVEIDDHGFLHLGIDAIYSGRPPSFEGSVILADEVLFAHVADDRGNRYRMVPADTNPTLRLERDQRLYGTLAFVPALDPDARMLRFANNQGSTTDPDDWARTEEPELFPRFVFDDVPLPGVGLDHLAMRAGDELLRPREVAVDVSQDHPVAEGVSLTITAIRADGQNVEIDLLAVNQTDRTIALANEDPLLRDDLDNRYTYAAIEDDDDDIVFARLHPGEEAEITFGFRGVLDESAEVLRLTLNSLSGGSSERIAPRFLFDDLPVPR